MSNIQDAVYTVMFDDDTSFNYKCKVDIDTRKIIEWEHIDNDNNSD